ncbi:leucine-rich repeat domain-containing protein [Leptospira santarosai]|uniref:leucine-rich repeat domain-containing protein n=1 Tax=Leptospira santarosai TaxID=28183 RepID=UPI000772EA40|nr:leucine-rich repeat domain-containing protein [Leptospira santarosai]
MKLQTNNWFRQLDVRWKEKFEREATMRKAVVDPEVILSEKGLTIYEADSIVSLEPISYFHKLKSLSVHNKNIIDLSPLQSLGNRLENLTITGSISDLSVLKNFKKLKQLTLSGSFENTPIPLLNNLEFLNIELSNRLEFLCLECVPIRSLAILESFTKLRKLEISLTKITDISPLRGLKKLEELILSNSPVTSFEALYKLSSLRYLFADNTNLSDLKPLYKTKKTLTIYCRKTKVSFEEILRFRNSLTSSSLIALNIISDYNENHQNFVKSLETVHFDLDDGLGDALTEWTYQRVGNLMMDNSIFKEDAKKVKQEKTREAIAILKAFLNLPPFKRNSELTEKRYNTLLQDCFLCMLRMDVDLNFEKKVIDQIPADIQSPNFAFSLARYFAKKADRNEFLRYTSICVRLSCKRELFYAAEEFKPFLNDENFKNLIIQMQE